MPLPIFEDILTIKTDLRKTFEVNIEPIFLDVCEQDSINIISIVGDTPCPLGATVQDDKILVKISDHYPNPDKIVLKIAGIRRDSNVRFPRYSEEQALSNSKFWDSWRNNNV